VVAIVKEKLAVSKQTVRRFDWETSNLRKLNELAIRRKYEIEITKNFAALENLNNDEDINSAWENIKENFKISGKQNLGLHKLKQHNPCFNEECLSSLDKRKQAKMQRIYDPSHVNVNNLNNVRHYASRHLRNIRKHI
jgi:hypothetical protein